MIRLIRTMGFVGWAVAGVVQAAPMDDLATWFATPPATRGEVPASAAGAALDSAADATRAAEDVWRAYQQGALALGWDKEIAAIPPTLEELAAMPEGGRPSLAPSKVEAGGKSMPYFLLAKGTKPAAGWPLILSLHGGGSSGGKSGVQDWPVNTREWQSQLALFERVYPENALYLIPRMADDHDGRWWYDYCQEMYRHLIRRALLFRQVDPDRVMVMGISEGGYAAFRLPANQPGVWAAAGAMAAAEPLDTSPPENLMHTALRCDIGENDTMFDRIGLARGYFKRLAELKAGQPGGYVHHLEVQAGRGHGIDYSGCPPWLLAQKRDPRPKDLVWEVRKLHQTLHRHNFWLELDGEPAVLPLTIRARIDGGTVAISVVDAAGEPAAGVKLRVLLDDALVDLGKPVTVVVNDRQRYQGSPGRTLGALATSLAARGDPRMMFCAEVRVVSE